jgi:hypothetical protein
MMNTASLRHAAVHAFCVAAGACMADSAWAQTATTAAPAAQPVTTAAAPTASAAKGAQTSTRRHSPFHQQQVTEKAQKYYASSWGVDKMKVSYTSSGNLIRFSYRVSDAERAAALSSKADAPVMVGQRSRAVLQVPVMDKVGPLRQAAAPKAGQEYWMVFSNKGNLVKPGDRVNVIIGQFHADGLMVE